MINKKTMYIVITFIILILTCTILYTYNKNTSLTKINKELKKDIIIHKKNIALINIYIDSLSKENKKLKDNINITENSIKEIKNIKLNVITNYEKKINNIGNIPIDSNIILFSKFLSKEYTTQ